MQVGGGVGGGQSLPRGHSGGAWRAHNNAAHATNAPAAPALGTTTGRTRECKFACWLNEIEPFPTALTVMQFLMPRLLGFDEHFVGEECWRRHPSSCLATLLTQHSTSYASCLAGCSCLRQCQGCHPLPTMVQGRQRWQHQRAALRLRLLRLPPSKAVPMEKLLNFLSNTSAAAAVMANFTCELAIESGSCSCKLAQAGCCYVHWQLPTHHLVLPSFAGGENDSVSLCWHFFLRFSAGREAQGLSHGSRLSHGERLQLRHSTDHSTCLPCTEIPDLCALLISGAFQAQLGFFCLAPVSVEPCACECRS